MDRSLVVRAQEGDEAAFRELAVAVGPALLRVARGILRDRAAAEDATQVALVQMWRQLRQLREPDRFDAWAYRVLVNACRTEGRRSGRAARVAIITDVPGADGNLGAVLDRDQLERGFRRLPFEQRTVLVLHLYLGLGNARIASILGIPEGTVRSRLYHGVRAMRAALAADARTMADLTVAREATR
ncbi:MAG: RNA polymerase sigma factor [Chloroflexi bacterium]|nr:RNA polymerase sigma factor [Chloroflexota bacterium]